MDHNRRDHDGGAAQEQEKRLDLSVAQVAGSALAAIAAAVLASQLGVYGTIVGAGVVSVVATCGGSVFQHLFRRTGEQIRDAAGQPRPGSRRVGAGSGQGRPAHGEFGAATTHGTRVRGWKRSALAASVVFAVAMAGITAYELAVGRELGGGAGTTVGSAVRGGGGGDSASPQPPSSPPPSSRSADRSGPGEQGDGGTDKGAGEERSPGASPGSSPREGGGEGASSGPPGGRSPVPGPSDPAAGPSGPSGGEESAPAPTPTPTESTGADAPVAP
ncbi:hypothetical protein [Streptomyces sp. NPDC059176]|uniref:hypothetical protein n=1 Tax=unclassified Streptomyces TaxID=2593676 RepID=UPI003679BB9A